MGEENKAQPQQPKADVQPHDDARDAKRAKTFDELDIQEQVQKLRQVCLQQAQQINGLHQLIENLMTHQHGADGRLMVPLYGRHSVAGGDSGSLGMPYLLR